MTIEEKKLDQMRLAISKKGVGAKGKMAEAIGCTANQITTLFKYGELKDSLYMKAIKHLNLRP